MLASENQRRDTEQSDERDDVVYITQEQPDGTRLEKRVDRAFLDLTDIQNREFRYAL
jgi:ACS family allantoate permease-like MFS transporter